MSKVLFLLAIGLLSVSLAFSQAAGGPTEGTLHASSKRGKDLGICPLKTTRVRTDISGFIARVRVVQEFRNEFTQPIEAVYTFPLSQNSAVDQMTMTIGERVINGKIMKRAEARKVYEAAKEEGKTASLLDQQRPNVFTQAVANILPGDTIVIEISYVETLRYEDGQYEFVFPMVVAPRYIPDAMKPGAAARVSPPISAERAGHDISIEVNLDAGVPVEAVRSASHAIETVNLSSNSAKITLKDEKTIPNKDFVLRYDVTGKRIEDALLTHRDERGGFFTMILQPPDKFAQDDITPKEIVFVLDTSGSMGGRPIEKAREAMKLSLDGLYPDDTFNIITFAGDTAILFDKPVYATQANLEKAQSFLDGSRSYGGTEMMKAIKAALDPSDSQEHLRIVCFMTDGEVGNDNEIIAEIQRHPKARVFSFGIGNSVNRFLLDKMAAEGNGEFEYVGLEDDGSKAAKKFYERVRTPLLTDLSVEWNGLPVADIYPRKMADLFSAKPVILHGRFTKAASGTVRLKGKVAGQEYSRDIAVNLPEKEAENDVLATLWARTQLDDLVSEARKYDNAEDPKQIALQKQAINSITRLGLDYHLMTQFTSFVAVEEKVVTNGGKPQKVGVPVHPVEGSTDENHPSFGKLEIITALQRPPAVKTGKAKGSGRGRGSGNGYGSGNGVSANYSIANSPASVSNLTISLPKVVSGGVLNGRAVSMQKPAYPAAARAANASGQVAVQVTIDESGNVISTSAVSGNPLLRAEAEAAAKGSKFSPTLLSGAPVKVTGVIVYNFNAGQSTQITYGEIAPTAIPGADEKPLTAEMLAESERIEREAKRRQMIAEKLQFWVFAVVERLQKGISAPALNEDKFVSEGKASVEIVVSETRPETLQKLKDLGFEIVSEKGNLKGTIPVAKLGGLAELAEVTLILPRML